MNLGEYISGILVKTLVTLLASLITKWLFDHSSKKKVFEKNKNLDALRDLLFSFERKHPAIVEEEVSNYLKSKFRYSEIILIMALKNPMHTFSLLKTGRAHLHFDDEMGTYCLKDSISSVPKENRRKNIFLIWYFFYAALSIYPLMMAPFLIGSYGMPALVTVLVWSVFLMYLAIGMLSEGLKISDAKKAMEQINYKFKKNE